MVLVYITIAETRKTVGLDINKNCLYGKMGDNDYNFAVFDMDDYSGSNHTWARNPSLKISSMKKLNEEATI